MSHKQKTSNSLGFTPSFTSTFKNKAFKNAKKPMGASWAKSEMEEPQNPALLSNICLGYNGSTSKHIGNTAFDLDAHLIKTDKIPPEQMAYKKQQHQQKLL